MGELDIILEEFWVFQFSAHFRSYDTVDVVIRWTVRNMINSNLCLFSPHVLKIDYRIKFKTRHSVSCAWSFCLAPSDLVYNAALFRSAPWMCGSRQGWRSRYRYKTPIWAQIGIGIAKVSVLVSVFFYNSDFLPFYHKKRLKSQFFAITVPLEYNFATFSTALTRKYRDSQMCENRVSSILARGFFCFLTTLKAKTPLHQ